ncbi:hypothetical protein [Streptomyces sirii]|uniref:hypothetical protein n=1 Tax=Streptomyces sirii TaxID=3127701 RepID=UPI003D35EB04
MSAFWNLRRIRTLTASWRDFERHDELDAVAELCGAANCSTERTVLRVSLFGFRAEAGGKTGFAALKILRREHPAVVHVLSTYFAVLAILVALFLASVGPQ